jgi:hypothetical protein
MSILQLSACLASTVAITAQWLDGFTTWQGIKKFGPSIEDDKSALAQWMVKHPSTLLYLKPAYFALTFSGLIHFGKMEGGTGYVLAIMLSVLGTALGADAAYGNYLTNKK